MKPNEPLQVSIRVGPTEVQIEAPVHEALTNWGLWQQQRAGGGRRTGSAEGRFRSAPAGAAGAPRVDPGHALEVERVVSAPTFPAEAATILRHHYVYQADWRATSRAVGVRWSEYGSTFRRATKVFNNRSRKP